MISCSLQYLENGDHAQSRTKEEPQMVAKSDALIYRQEHHTLNDRRPNRP